MSLSREEVQASLSELDAALQQVDTLLKPVLSKSLAETTKDMDPLENAKLQVNLAYTMNTLYYMYMKLQNANLAGHEIVKDMERLRGYMKKLQATQQAGSAAEPTLKLNKAAAKRFVQSSLSTPVEAQQSKAEKEEQEEDLDEAEDGSGNEESMDESEDA